MDARIEGPLISCSLTCHAPVQNSLQSAQENENRHKITRMRLECDTDSGKRSHTELTSERSGKRILGGQCRSVRSPSNLGPWHRKQFSLLPRGCPENQLLNATGLLVYAQ